jgi:hypothetical protein
MNDITEITKSIDRKLIKAKLGDEAYCKLISFLTNRRKEIKDHFKRSDWTLDFQILLDQAIHQVIGVELISLVAKYYTFKDVKLMSTSKAIYLVKDKNESNTKVRKKTKSKRK